jgi:DNA adenine methylase
VRYLGGKSKIRKQVAAVLEMLRLPGQTYFEPFCGGAWVLQEMSGPRIASDGNAALITLYRALQTGWAPPGTVPEDEYRAIYARNDPEDPLTAFSNFGCSFGGNWGAGYARTPNDGRNYASNARNSLLKQLPAIQDVEFRYGVFTDHAPDGMLVYCDPPYKGTTTYGGCAPFDHGLFWDTARFWSMNNTVVVSEYSAPGDFDCIAEFPSKMGLRSGKSLDQHVRTERLFMYGGTP